MHPGPGTRLQAKDAARLPVEVRRYNDKNAAGKDGSTTNKRPILDYHTVSGRWFQTFFIFHNIWDNPSH